MKYNPNDEKIKEISKELLSLPTENQRILFLSTFCMSKDINYLTKIIRDGENVQVELSARKDKLLSETEVGAACFQTAASFLKEACKKLQISVLDILPYLGLFVDGKKEGENDK